jgi:hypothetical protein
VTTGATEGLLFYVAPGRTPYHAVLKADTTQAICGVRVSRIARLTYERSRAGNLSDARPDRPMCLHCGKMLRGK